MRSRKIVSLISCAALPLLCWKVPAWAQVSGSNAVSTAPVSGNITTGALPTLMTTPPTISIPTVGTAGYGSCGYAQYAEDTTCITPSDPRFTYFGGQPVNYSGVTEMAGAVQSTATPTGTFSSGSTAVTLSSGTGTDNGELVVGTGIPAGTFITAGGGTTSITLNQATTAAGTNVPLTIVNRQLNPWAVEFWVNLQGNANGRFELNFIGASAPLDVLIDGQYAVAKGTTTINPGYSNSQSLGISYGVAAGSHRIRIESSIRYFNGVRIPPVDSLWKVSTASNKYVRAAIMGDSMVAGTGATTVLLGLSPELCKLMNWQDCWTLGRGSSGYQNPAVLTAIQRAPYDLALMSPKPQVVFVWFGINDGSQTASAVQSAVTSYYQYLRGILSTTTPIIVSGPQQPTNNYTSAAIVSAIQAGLGVGSSPAIATSSYDPYLFYINNQSWFPGTGRVGATTGVGPSDWVTGTDGIHPTQNGHDAYAVEFYGAITSILNNLQ